MAASEVTLGGVAASVVTLGGVASWRELRVQHPARRIRRSVAAGLVVRAGRGRYVLPSTEAHRTTAAARSATLSHLSAALHHGWKVKTVPVDAWVTVRRKRHLRAADLVGVVPRWAELDAADVRAGVTAPLRTVLDCARALPFDEALAVADSALRAGDVTPGELLEGASRATGPGSRRVARVARLADGRAANPFESVLRALCLEEGLDLTPQLQIAESGLFALVDLGSTDLGLVVEAEGFEHHGTRKGLRKDCRRHTELAVFGWSSLRYAFEDVMFDQGWVRWTLRSWRDVRSGRTPTAPPQRSPRQANAA